MRKSSRIAAGAVVAATAAATALATLAIPASATSTNSTPITYDVNPAVKLAFTTARPGAFPAPSVCEANYGLACYTPQEIRTAYDIPAGDTGAGQTIVIVDAYGSPTVVSDLHTFDHEFGLSDPTLNIIYPGGSPTFNPLQNHAEYKWADETSLDTQWAHAIAPDATIDLVIAANNGGNVLNNAEQYAVSHHLGNVMSMSFGAPEAAINGGGNNLQLQQASQIYQQAASQGMSVFASAGDLGATNNTSTINAGYPASDPNVTSVGGTDLFLSDTGAYQSEYTWNDSVASQCPFGCTAGVFGATGGAPSAVFSTPSYQAGVTGYSTRTVPDVGYNASVYTAVMVYLSVPNQPSGFYFFGGTSEGAPQWAAITALTDQVAGHALGQLNPALYAIYRNAKAYAADFHDVTVGNNNFFNEGGFTARTGYDLTTGLGTPNVANLIASLTGTTKKR